jgi:predicted porin
MKKSLIAVAVLGAFAGAASAQSSVTLYGLIDTYLEAGKRGNASVTKLSPGGLSGSRWGLRGSEDLGGGLKAVFTLEGGIASDTGQPQQGAVSASNCTTNAVINAPIPAGTTLCAVTPNVTTRLFGRQAYVGLAGGFGELLVGRQYAPIFYTQLDSDIDGLSTFSVPPALFNNDGNTLRQDNMIKYNTPNLGGFTASLSFTPGENPSTAAGGSSAQRKFGANAKFAVGPVTLVAGYHDDKANQTSVKSIKAYALGARYKAGMIDVAANYWQHKVDNVSGPDPKLTTWSIGPAYQMGAVRLVAQYGQLKNDVNNGKEKAWLLGGDYALSKRTDTYVRFAQVKDTGGATAAGWYGLGDVPTNDKNRTIAIGLRHRF